MARTRRITSIALSTLAAATGMGLVPTAAHAAGNSGTIHVDNTPGQNCTDTGAGAGSQTTPFCTIEAAVATAGPGATVLVGGDTVGGYTPTAPITPPSGTPGAPITIKATSHSIAIHTPFGSHNAIDLNGVHDVVFQGFALTDGLTAENSSRITLADDQFGAWVQLTATTDSVITRNVMWPGLTLSAGSADATVTDDIVTGPGGGPVLSVWDSPRARIVNDTVPSGQLEVRGTSTDAVVENNIIGESTTIAESAATGLVEDYNMSPGISGTTSVTPGPHDLATSPNLGGTGLYPFYVEPMAGSPVIDSADPNAPGIPATDFYGNGPVAYPGVSGTSSRDRGAIESNGIGGVGLTASTVTDHSAYRTRTFTATQSGDLWGTGLKYAFDFGDGHTSGVQDSPSAAHTFAADGDYTVTVTVTDSQGQSRTTTSGVVVVPRSRPDIVIASRPQTGSVGFWIEAQSPAGLSDYPPAGSYSVDWGDGSPASTAVPGNHVVGAAHTYAAGTTDPKPTMTLVDPGGWAWQWAYDGASGVQNPPVASPPSPGGWEPTGNGSTGGGTGGGPGGGTGGGNGGSPGGPAAAPVVQRLGGADRYDTGRRVSQAQWGAGKAAAVVLARGDQAPDALAGVPLAATKNGPLLLTDPKALDPATRAEIDRVLGGPGTKKTIYILGGDSAVSPQIEAQLRKAGYTVTRLAGADRYSTALTVAAQFGATSSAIVATGKDFPDALAAGPLGALRDAPIVLSGGPALDASTAAFLKSRQTLYAVGGAAVNAVATLDTHGKTVTRLAGSDRFATAAAVAGAVTTALGHAPTGAGVAYAFNFPDALTGGAFAATAHQPLLLTDKARADAGLLAELHGFGPTLTGVEIFGGTSVIAQSAEDQVAAQIHGVER
ncbi:putative cell wall-binding protein [Catenulispora sp. GAS73]|uniref:cell wall-binding repeat-containing protein n=1 Tax=Catenulispora sp. GAS73 TaxID=3156269 RepID=UPI003517CA0E